MSADTPDQRERECRELLELMHDHATHDMAVTHDAQLRESAAAFLAEHERITELTGHEFCEAALLAIDRYDGGDEAEYERQVRERFEDLCGGCVQLLEAQDGWYPSIGKRDQAREPSPAGKRFREQATVFLAEADRIRALTGDDFILESQSAVDAFTSLDDMETVKAEIHEEWAATPLVHRWRRKLVDRFSS